MDEQIILIPPHTCYQDVTNLVNKHGDNPIVLSMQAANYHNLLCEWIVHIELTAWVLRSILKQQISDNGMSWFQLKKLYAGFFNNQILPVDNKLVSVKVQYE